METGLSTACFFGQMHLEETLKIIEKLGVKTIEVFLNTFSEYKEEFVKDFRKRAADCGIRINSVHPHGIQYEPQLFSTYDRAHNDALDIFKRVANACEILGANVTVMHGAVNFKKTRRTVINYSHIAATVDEAAEIAKGYGVKLAYENVHWCLFQQPEFATQLKALTRSDNVYFNFDVKQEAQGGVKQMEIYDAMMPRVANVHVCDIVHEDDPQFISPRMPFTGELDMELLRSRLKETGYNNVVVMEIYGNNFKDLAELKDYYQRFNEFFAD